MISKFEIGKRLFTTIIALLQPFIIYFVCGDLISISQSWNTPLQPLFIFTNALVSYFFFDIHNWRIPAILLLLLTVFSVKDYFMLHNILAISFFIYNYYLLYDFDLVLIHNILYSSNISLYSFLFLLSFS